MSHPQLYLRHDLSLTINDTTQLVNKSTQDKPRYNINVAGTKWSLLKSREWRRFRKPLSVDIPSFKINISSVLSLKTRQKAVQKAKFETSKIYKTIINKLCYSNLCSLRRHIPTDNTASTNRLCYPCCWSSIYVETHSKVWPSYAGSLKLSNHEPS